jgi:hypothetical protein
MSDDLARTNTIQILTDPALNHIRFSVGSVAITPDVFTRVSAALRQKRLAVLHDSTMVGPGYYDPAVDTLYFRRDVFPDIPAQALVVHEACHAGLDIS